MCGRFVSAAPPDELARYFGAESDEAGGLEANFNVAPTNEVYVVRARDAVRQLSALRWGLVPFWAKDLKIGSRMINARAETVAEKPAFRKAAAMACIHESDQATTVAYQVSTQIQSRRAERRSVSPAFAP